MKISVTLMRRRGCKGKRSEEHTSELQSLAYLVCRLLLEKKKSFHVVQEHVAFRVDRLHAPADHGLDHRVAISEVVLHGGTVAVAARLADVVDRDVVDATL